MAEGRTGPLGGRPADELEEGVTHRALTERLFGRRLPPLRIARYTVSHKLGSGGMGAVYAARDPELHRTVAIKLLRHQGGPSASQRQRQRLIREARAMARVDHPNVVKVFDAGTHDDVVYIAMELIDGVTLRVWLEQRRRPWPHVLAVFVPAANALAAAHARGLVHGDFKPDNVMIETATERVCVLDFGLARDTPDRPASERQSSSGVLARSTADATPTAGGSLGGTAHYAAPELLDGGSTDARADQFSFCVALFEALYAARPFSGTNADDLLRAIRLGRVAEVAATRRVPRALNAIVLRGLEADPSRRFASMSALQRALRDVLPSPRRRIGLALAAGTAIATLGIVRLGDEAPPCGTAELAFAGVWDAERQAAVREAMLATGAPYAESMWTQVREEFDAHVEDWMQVRTETCNAILSTAPSAAAELDHRMTCLDRRVAEFTAAVQLLADADATVLEHAVDVLGGLTHVDACTEAPAAVSLMPRDPLQRREVETVRRDLAILNAEQNAGRFERSLVRAKEALKVAERIGHAPLLAEALHAAGVAEQARGSLEQARDLLTQAYATGMGSGQVQVARRSATVLVRVVADQGNPEQALDWSRIALAEARRSADQALRWQVLLNVAILQRDRGALAEATAALDEALALVEVTGALGDRHAAQTLERIGQVLNASGRHEDALEVERQAHARFEAAYPAKHPLIGSSHVSLAISLSDLGRYTEALEHYREGRAILSEAYGANREVARLDVSYGQTLANVGRTAEAMEVLTAAERTLTGELGPVHADLGYVAMALGETSFKVGDLDAALRHRLRAVEVFRAAYGDEHPRVGTSQFVTASTLLALGRKDDALELLSRSLATLERTLGSGRAMTLQARISRGAALTDLGRPAEAVVELERVMKASQAELLPTWRASARFQLARALWDADSDRGRAVELAHDARDLYGALGPRGERYLPKIETWLAERT